MEIETGPASFIQWSDNYQRDYVDKYNRDQFPSITQNEDSAFDWNDFYTVETINAWIVDQAKAYPNIATVITAGKSFWNRTLTGLRIAHKPGLPIVFVQAGMHAREWITPSTATWFIQQALTSDSEVIKSFEWHVLPVVNPDGYHYTRWSRKWIKNMEPLPFSYTCLGSNLERNWPNTWSVISGNPCDETYPGNGGGSQAEIKALIDYLGQIADRTKVFITLLANGQSIMYPYGYSHYIPPRVREYELVASKAAKKMSTRFGYRFEHGTMRDIAKDEVKGTSIDYAQSINITYPFAMALRKGNPGKDQFMTPKQEIMPIVLEAFDAMEAILAEARN